MTWKAWFVLWNIYSQCGIPHEITPASHPDGRRITWGEVYCDLRHRNALFQYYVGFCHLRVTP
jgi:hypothetical protein